MDNTLMINGINAGSRKHFSEIHSGHSDTFTDLLVQITSLLWPGRVWTFTLHTIHVGKLQNMTGSDWTRLDFWRETALVSLKS